MYNENKSLAEQKRVSVVTAFVVLVCVFIAGLLAGILLFTTFGSAWAQESDFTFGTVACSDLGDANCYAPLADVKVTISYLSETGQQVFTAATDKDGIATFVGLPRPLAGDLTMTACGDGDFIPPCISRIEPVPANTVGYFWHPRFGIQFDNAIYLPIVR